MFEQQEKEIERDREMKGTFKLYVGGECLGSNVHFKLYQSHHVLTAIHILFTSSLE